MTQTGNINLTKGKVLLIILILVAMILFIAGYLFAFSASGEYYKTFSPDNQYSVYASKYHYENFIPKMSGQSGDAARKVFLYDEVERKIPNSAKIPMLWMTDEMVWEENEAYLKGADYPNISDPWHLPRPIKMPYTQTEENDSVRIIREYSAFDELSSVTTQKQISACWKPINYEAYDEQGNKTLEWQIYHSKAEESTCDFTSYYAHYRHYQNGKLIRELFKHAGCDDCESYPCGTETAWDEAGKIIFQEKYGDCDVNFRPEQKQEN